MRLENPQEYLALTFEVVNNPPTGVLTYTPAFHRIADDTYNQHTAIDQREVE